MRICRYVKALVHICMKLHMLLSVCTGAHLLECKLKEHVEKHHIKIKRYACDECTYRATSKGRLNEHKRSCKFTSSRKFKCDHCPSMGFVRKDSFMRHMNKWH